MCNFCGAISWKEEFHSAGRPPCCDGGNTEIPAPESNLIRNLDDPHIIAVNKLLHDTEIRNNQTRRTRQCQQFHDNINGYNNAVSFASEGCDMVDRTVGHYTFRLQGGIYHNMPSLEPEHGIRPRFAQIYTVDSVDSTEELDNRLYHVPDLNPSIIEELQNHLHAINPYPAALKFCSQLLAEEPDVGRAYLTMQNPQEKDPRTYNRPSSDEVAVVIIGNPDDSTQEGLERDIQVHYKTGHRQNIPYWHPSYMALRYPVFFPAGDRSWQVNIPRRNQLIHRQIGRLS